MRQPRNEAHAPAQDRASRQELAEWIDAGWYLRAHPHVDALAASEWPDDRLLAARALRNLGADRQGDALILRAGRRFSGHLGARAAALRAVLSRRGPYLAWQLAQRWRDEPEGASPLQRAEWRSVLMRLACQLRDFERVDELHDQVLELEQSDAWLWVEWSYCCRDRDDLDGAMAAVDRALHLQPKLRSATQWRAALMRQTGAHRQARELLQSAFAACECAGYGWQLYPILVEANELQAAARTLDRIELLQPRSDAIELSRLAARRCDIALRMGDWSLAREQAGLASRWTYYERLLKRLESIEGPPRRVELAVPWVRQHWLTCAPATLTALAAWWQRPVDHLELAEAICYEGTSHVAERRWAADSGYVVREFSVDWASACALIDAGMPFTLTTSAVDNAHLQAVVGYDAAGRTLLVRDPMDPDQVEFDADATFERWRHEGPRGMVFVPPEQAARLDAIALPDASAWDGYHAVNAALDRHDREAAVASLAQMAPQHGGHVLHLRAARSIALHDGDEPAILAWTERLLALHPEEPGWQLSKAASIWAIGGRDPHLKWLNALAANPSAPASVLVCWADRLADDERRRPQAQAAVRRALRQAPAHDGAWSQWAGLVWGIEPAAALPLYRNAACLRGLHEDRSAAYARACRLAGHPQMALDYLRSRVDRLGAKSGGPARTLFGELEAQGRADEGLVMLHSTLELRPGDAALALFVAECALRYGRADDAEALLQSAEAGTAARSAVLRMRALVSEHRLAFDEALVAAQQACALEPLNMSLRRLVVQLHNRIHGRDSALVALREVANRFSHHVELQRLLYDWLPDEPEVIDAQLAHLRAIQPDDPWAWREQAVQWARRQRYDEALEQADSAMALSGGSASCLGVRGWVRCERDGWSAARADLEAAIARDVDQTFVIRYLVGQAPDRDAARSALELIQRELLRQPAVGDGILSWRAWAQEWLPAEAIHAVLDLLAQRHPTAWSVPVARALQHLADQQTDAALTVLDSALVAYPLVVRLHLERAEVLRTMQRRDEAAVASEAALALDPASNRAVRLLVDILSESSRDWPRAEVALRRALALTPSDADLRALLGWVHEQAGRHEEALQDLQTALAQDAEPKWIWDTVSRCATALGRPARRLELVAALEAVRPGDPWLRLARADFSGDGQQALQATEEALARSPRLVAAWRARFEQLMQLKRYRELHRLARALPWPDGGPIELRLWEARAERASGEKAVAPVTLKSLLSNQPNDFVAWQQLADWHDEDDEHEAYREAAQQMLRLGSSSALAHGYLGHALLKAGRTAEAVPSLRRALELDPAFTFMALRLSEAALAAGTPERASEPMESLWPRRPTLQVASAGFRLAVALRDDASIERWLWRAMEAEPFAVDDALQLTEQAREAGHGSLLRRLQHKALQDGSCALGFGLDWLRQRGRDVGFGHALREAKALMAASKGRALPLAMLRWINEMGTPGDFADFVDGHAARLRADPNCWGDVSYLLLGQGRHWMVSVWLADWREHPDAPVWALTNLCLALAAQGRFRDLAEPVAAVLARDPLDTDALLWQCAHASAVGVPGEASEILDRLDMIGAPDWTNPWRALLRAFLTAVEAGNSRHAVATVVAARQRRDHTMRPLIDRLCTRLLREYTPRGWPRAWRWFQLNV